MIKIDDAVSPLDANAGYWAQMNAASIGSYLKSTAIISALAASVFAFAYLAYTNPSKWMLTTASFIVVNLYALPKILRYGNATMIKLTLVANLVALSSLSLGGIGAASFILSRGVWIFLKNYRFELALSSSFFLTGMLGYGVPLFKDALAKSYHFLQDPDIQERFTSLQEHFHKMPEVGLGFMQGCLWESFVLHIALFRPKFLLDLCEVFSITLPNYAWPMIALASEKIDQEQFNQLLTEMENLSDLVNLQGNPLSNHMQANYHLSIKVALESLKPADLPSSISTLLLRGAKLIPNIISNEQFLELFIDNDNALNATNESIQNFLELMDNWEDLVTEQDALSIEVKQLEQEIQNQNIQQLISKEEDLFQCYEGLQQQFSALRVAIEKVYSQKRIWQDFAPLWNNKTDLPFEKSEELLKILHDQNLLKEIEDTYRTMIGTGQGANRTLIDRLQYIKNKLATLHADAEQEDAVPAIMHLAANKGFVQKDFEDLQEWLDVDSPHDLENALAEIGLATEEDLYENEILFRQGQISKEIIRTNLRRFIEEAPQPQLADRVQSEEKMDETAPPYKTVEKVTRFIYYAITSGLLVVPVLIRPYIGGTGFALGACFFILKRFGFPGTQALADYSYEILQALPLGGFLYSLLGRRVFSINPHRREETNRFVNADFFARMRIINLRVFLCMFISCFSVRFSDPGLGSLLQGMALADEVVSLF